MSQAAVSLDKVTKVYKGPKGDVHALVNLSLSIDAGDFLAVQGPSGCGKTTLLLVAGGLLAPNEGQVVVGDHDLYKLSPSGRAAVRAANIGFVFQQFHLVPYLNVLDNVLVPSLQEKYPGARQRAMELLAHFGLEKRLTHVPSQLSTGEKQRTALARSLMNDPRVLLADEPTGNLDDQNTHAVLEYLVDFAAGGGAVILATHDTSAAQVAGKRILLKEGKPVESSTSPRR